MWDQNDSDESLTPSRRERTELHWLTPPSAFFATLSDKLHMAEMEKSNMSKLKKSEMQEKNLLSSKEMTEQGKQVGDS
ncbi:thymosin beta-4, Y-chromosomal-like [Camelus dromedarius]|uniref:Thymosin beta-4, Y-chromosomal-like n=2 Tax=Camelus TaxID=9836 RepID=A0A8B8T9L4_CAMFR|nr:thymosin beta-4, Y-chromosomal-like [Camelus ferus]XP_045380187.1 thymosin beta-4, Y-chromosomal-like [Camelus bactrianus]